MEQFDEPEVIRMCFVEALEYCIWIVLTLDFLLTVHLWLRHEWKEISVVLIMVGSYAEVSDFFAFL